MTASAISPFDPSPAANSGHPLLPQISSWRAPLCCKGAAHAGKNDLDECLLLQKRTRQLYLNGR
jgi:hypothetical protein